MKPGNKSKQMFGNKASIDELDKKIFFVIKFWLMSVFQGTAIIVIVFFLGQINALGLLLLGAVLFVVSLVLSRRFDKQINALALWLASIVNKHPKIRELIVASV